MKLCFILEADESRGNNSTSDKLPTAIVVVVTGVPADFASSRVRSLRGRPRPSFFFGTSSGAATFGREAASCGWLAGLSVTVLSIQQLLLHKKLKLKNRHFLLLRPSILKLVSVQISEHFSRNLQN